MPEWLILLVENIVKILMVLVPLLMMAALLTWDERKQSALMQDRLGPNRANIGPFTLWGLIHPIADTVKMFFKEDIVPQRADKLLHALAPVLALSPSLFMYAVIPFGPVVRLGGRDIPMQISDLNAGLIIVLAISSIAVYGIALAGWASNNKFSLLGALRAAAQMVSYEITMGLSLIGTLQTSTLVLKQTESLWGWLPMWGVFVQPVGFILYGAAALAELKRAPFDVPEGESEIVAGFWTEYSGMRWGMFYVGEFVEISVLSGIAVVFFFGGYHVPGIDPAWATVGHAGLDGWVWALIMLCAFGLKIIVGNIVLQQIRWTFPRFRYDQVMNLGWKILLPIALANIFVTGVILLL
jgi:NADH-quinone oxidoreductase subunit H